MFGRHVGVLLSTESYAETWFSNFYRNLKTTFPHKTLYWEVHQQGGQTTERERSCIRPMRVIDRSKRTHRKHKTGDTVKHGICRSSNIQCQYNAVLLHDDTELPLLEQNIHATWNPNRENVPVQKSTKTKTKTYFFKTKSKFPCSTWML